MSQENVEVVRRALDAFNREDLAAATRENVPDVVVDWSRSRGLEAGIYQGRDGVTRFWHTFFEAFDRVVVRPERLIDHGDQVVLFDRTRLSGRYGIELEVCNASVVQFRDGRISRWTMYPDRTEALEAVGLTE